MPEVAAGIHNHQVFGVGDEFVALAVVVGYHALGHPRDDLLISVLVQSDQGPRC